MRKIALCFLLLVGSLFARDVRLQGPAAYQVGGRGLTWASGVNVNFVLDVPSPNSGVCASFSNNDSSTHTFTIGASITADPAVTTYTGNTGNWTTTPISPGTTGSVAGNVTTLFWLNAAGASHVTISVSGGSGTGTVDVVFSQAATTCVGVNQNGSVFPLASSVPCSRSAVGTLAASASIQLIAAPPTGQFIHICAYSIGGPNAGGNNTVMQFSNGANCSGVGAVQWEVSPNTSGSVYQLGAGLGQLFQTSVAAQPMCVTQGASGATYFVAVSYNIF